MGAWTYLAVAIGLEVAGTLMLKLSDGFENWLWGTGAMICYGFCFWLFALALKHLPVGLAYAIWAGLGIVAATLIGVVGFGEKLSAAQYGYIALVVVGAVGLRVSTTA